MTDPNEVFGLIKNKTELINKIIDELEGKVDKAQGELLRTVVDDFIDKLDVDEDGNLKNTSSNRIKLSILDRVYKKYINDISIDLIKAVTQGVDDILNINGVYYKEVFAEESGLRDIFQDTKKQIRDWLGITNKGGLVENGYLFTLVNNQEIRSNIQNSVFKSIVSQKGFFEVKKDLKNYIAGNQGQAGALQKYYRNFVYDTFNQVDRTQIKIIADRLQLKYSIYEGGIIKTTRPFCRQRNGKVFTDEEVEQFDPPTAKQPNYNPFTDLGGYACRHHLNYIPELIAFKLRPELKVGT